MRRQEQLELVRLPAPHSHAAELEQISRVLDANPRMAGLVTQDLLRGLKNPETGARGLTGDQVLRILILKQMKGFSYEALAFHLGDSLTYRAFCRLGAFAGSPSASTLAENIGKLRPKTLEKINRRLVRYAVSLGIEPGKRVRIDATPVETNIHAPTDSSLLYDGVRVLARLLGRAKEATGFSGWSDHTKRAKRRAYAIQYRSSATKRLPLYRDLLKVSIKTARYAERACAELRGTPHGKLAAELDEMTSWLWMVIDQTDRRVFKGEQVRAEEKLLSIFEPHTDVIVKDRREPRYGHKLYLSAGASGLITDCVIAAGNPADSTMSTPMLKRQCRILGRIPEQGSLDGGFASKQNLMEGKALGIQDLCFAKKRGLEVHEMVRSSWVYRQLKNFRAGIEGLISFLKRAFGLDRCTWKGLEGFGRYVQASVLSANLLTLSRHLLV